MNTRQIVFTAYSKAELLVVPLKEMDADSVLIRTAYTAISAGTERANIMGDGNIPGMRGKNFENVFPRFLGYSGTGIVEAVGRDVRAFAPGDRVLAFWGTHSEYLVMPEKQVVKLPDNVELLDAAFCFIATFPIAALRKTKIEIGESAMIMGLGLLGLISVELMRIAGAAPIIAVDPNPERRAAALSLGADFALDPLRQDFVSTVKALTEGKGVHTCIEVTGVGKALNQALLCMAHMGRIALLGCTRKPTEVDFYYDVHLTGVSIFGAHATARPEFESYPHHWTNQDDCKALLKLISLGRLDLHALIHEVNSPGDAPAVYRRLVEDPGFPIGCAFEWSRLNKS